MNSSSGRLIVAILAVAAVAVGFWMLLLGPKREEADQLSAEVETLEVTLAQANSSLAAGEAAREEFPDNYRQLVVLGEAVPEGDETASLFVEINRIAKASKVRFETIQLSTGGEGETTEAPVAPAPVEPTPAPESPEGSVPAAATLPPTEATAALMPLGASIGPAGLGVMPYTLNFRGNFFEIADFIEGVDALVATHNAKVGVEGRLVTVDGFSLVPTGKKEKEDLNVSFVVTTFVTPPEEGLTAGASASEPAPISSDASGGEEASEAGAAQ